MARKGLWRAGFLVWLLLGLLMPPLGWTQGGGPGDAPHPVDINKATLEELVAVPGLGPAKSRAILKYREEHGPFTRLEDLIQVRGIGPRLLERLRPYLTVTPSGDPHSLQP